MKKALLEDLNRIKKPGEEIYDPLRHPDWRPASSSMGAQGKKIYQHTVLKYTFKNGKTVYAVFDEYGNIPVPPAGEAFSTEVLKLNESSSKWKVYALVAVAVIMVTVRLFAPYLASIYKAKNDPYVKYRNSTYESYNRNVEKLEELTAKARLELDAVTLYSNDTHFLSIDLQPNLSDLSRGFNLVPAAHFSAMNQKMTAFIDNADSIGFNIWLKTGRTTFYQGRHLKAPFAKSTPVAFLLSLDYRVSEMEKAALRKQLDENPHPFREEMEAELAEDYKTILIPLSYEELFSGEIQPMKRLLLSELKTNPDCKLYFTPAVNGSLSKEEFSLACQQLSRILENKYELDACNFSIQQLSL